MVLPLVDISPTQPSNPKNEVSKVSTKLNHNYDHNDIVAHNKEFIKELNIHKLKHLINPNPVTFNTYSQVNDYLCKQDLVVYLGANSNRILDLFHDESNLQVAYLFQIRMISIYISVIHLQIHL